MRFVRKRLEGSLSVKSNNKCSMQTIISADPFFRHFTLGEIPDFNLRALENPKFVPNSYFPGNIWDCYIWL